MTTRRPTNEAVLATAIRLLGPAARRAIRACARLSLGEARDLDDILAAARRFGAEPRVVAAAFGFLPDARSPRRYLDVWADDECSLALLSSETPVMAAFALSRAVHPAGCSLMTG